MNNEMFLDSYDSYDCCVLNLMATSDDIPEGFIQTTRFWIEIGQQLLAWISTANSNAAAAVQGEMWIFSKSALREFEAISFSKSSARNVWSPI